MPSKTNTSLSRVAIAREFRMFNEDRVGSGLRPLSWATWFDAKFENNTAWELERSGVPRKTVLQMVRE